MAFKKLTYSDSDYNNYIYISLKGDVFDTEAVTMALGIAPTSVVIKKNPVPSSTSWVYQINAGKAIDMETPLEKLVSLFEPKTDQINQLKAEPGLTTLLQLVIQIDISPDASTPYFGLHKKVINFLSKTQTEVDFDVYKVDSIGVINGMNPRASPGP